MKNFILDVVGNTSNLEKGTVFLLRKFDACEKIDAALELQQGDSAIGAQILGSIVTVAWTLYVIVDNCKTMISSNKNKQAARLFADQLAAPISSLLRRYEESLIYFGSLERAEMDYTTFCGIMLETLAEIVEILGNLLRVHIPAIERRLLQLAELNEDYRKVVQNRAVSDVM